MEYLKIQASDEQTEVIKQTLKGESMDHRLVDMEPVFEEMMQQRSDIFTGAVKIASVNVLSLMDKLKELRDICASPKTGDFMTFFRPIMELINASTNGLKKNKSKPYFDYVSSTGMALTEFLIKAAVSKDIKSKHLEEFERGVADWVAAHAAEIAKYVVKSKLQEH